MTVSVGTIALASDYEILADKVDAWFTDNCPSCTFGDSNERSGWGGTTTPLVASADEMLASQMNELIDRINIGATITGVASTLPRLSPGDLVLASQYNNAEANELLVAGSKNNILPGELSLINGTQSQRTASYTSAVNTTFRYTFSNFNEARYFFNSGGSLDFNGTISGYTTGWGYDGQGVNAILTTMGTISMNYTLTTQSGSGGTTTTLGYYDLTTSYQLIFQQAGTGAYSDAYVRLEARRSILGEYVEVRFSVIPETGRIVDGTTTAYAKYKKLDDQSSGSILLQIDPPSTIAVVEPF